MTATIKVLSAGAVEYVVTGLAKTFTGDTGIAVDFTFNTIAGVRKRLAAGETGDIVIGTAAAVAQMAEAGVAMPGSLVTIGRTLSGICVREGSAIPDISTAESFKAALLACRAFAYTDPAHGGTSGIYLTGLMQRLGILESVQKKAVLCINGEDVVNRLVSGEADLGSTFVSEFFLADGIASAGPIPASFGNATSYTAALLAPGRNKDAAQRFIAMITAPAQKSAWVSGGFEPAA